MRCLCKSFLISDIITMDSSDCLPYTNSRTSAKSVSGADDITKLMTDIVHVYYFSTRPLDPATKQS